MNGRRHSNTDYLFSVLFSLVAVLLIASTAYDVSMRQREKDPHKLWIAFSLYTNGTKLFDVTRNTSNSAIDCINGLRALALLWILFGHRTHHTMGMPLTNAGAWSEWNEGYWYSLIGTFYFWIETFLVLAAVLVTWSFLHALDT